MKKILFVCVENAGRSQMAEAFFKKYLPLGFLPISAGTNPALKINPMVIQVMKEIGIDIENSSPQNISQQMIDEAEITVNMGCMDKESCPSLFVKDVIDWNISDPKEKTINQVRIIRDQIKSEVIHLIDSLEEKKIKYSNLQIFIAELIGTFILIIFATGSIVYDAKVFDAQLGIPFAALAPFLALLIGVYAFGRVSLAHFNPAVTIGYYITGHITKLQVVYYFAAEIIEKYKLIYAEDAVHEEAFEDMSELTAKFPKVLITGDDLIVTSKTILTKAISLKSCNAAILKVNQAGSLYDALEFANEANQNNIRLITSHRSGESTDSQISHIGLATKSKMLKVGIVGGERVAKLNELLRLSEHDLIRGMAEI